VKVYKAISAVQADLCKEGITKDRKNEQQGYKFRGIDDVYNALSPLLAKHGLCVLPWILSRTVTERETQKGGVIFNVVVEAEFDLVCSEDGSKHTVRTYGEAMDTADKATNKAMSAAYKYFALMTWAVPTEGDNDADAHTPPEIKARPKAPEKAPEKPAVGGITDEQRHQLRDRAKALFGPGYVASLKAIMQEFGGAVDSLHLTQDGCAAVLAELGRLADVQAAKETA
jgi:hypothetical protein